MQVQIISGTETYRLSSSKSALPTRDESVEHSLDRGGPRPSALNIRKPFIPDSGFFPDMDQDRADLKLLCGRRMMQN